MRNNVRYIDPGSSSGNAGSGSCSLVYPAAGLGVVLDPVKGTQRFFRGHTDDITALAVYVPQSDGGWGKYFIFILQSYNSSTARYTLLFIPKNASTLRNSFSCSSPFSSSLSLLLLLLLFLFLFLFLSYFILSLSLYYPNFIPSYLASLSLYISLSLSASDTSNKGTLVATGQQGEGSVFVWGVPGMSTLSVLLTKQKTVIM
jgi:hypothetical protein